MKFLICLFVVTFFAFSFAEESENFKCKDGVNYKENDCNGCFCQQGQLGCTLMACRTHQNPTYMNCKVGTTWTKDCNECWCVKHMGTICTANKC